MTIPNFLSLKQIGLLTPFIQVVLILVLFGIAVITQWYEYKRTGKTYGKYPWRISTFLSSIYEEIIFRGIILFGLLTVLAPLFSVVISSILFGLFHLKNYKWQTKAQTRQQVLYAGIIFGPIASVIILWTGTIWLAVIFHYLHNLFVDAYRKVPINERFIMLSNVFLILPVIFAALYHQWLYCFFATGLFIFSRLFHWYRISNRSSQLFQIFKTADWMFAVGAFLYMYFYIYTYTKGKVELILNTLLTLVVVFFWYGWKRADYEKLHPWFHVVAPVVSSLILIAVN